MSQATVTATMDETDARARGRATELLRALAGTLAAGLLLLAIVLVIIEGLGTALNATGLRPDVLIGHVVGGILAVAGATVAERSRRRAALFASVGSLAVTAVTLLAFWYS